MDNMDITADRDEAPVLWVAGVPRLMVRPGWDDRGFWIGETNFPEDGTGWSDQHGNPLSAEQVAAMPDTILTRDEAAALANDAAPGDQS